MTRALIAQKYETAVAGLIGLDPIDVSFGAPPIRIENYELPQDVFVPLTPGKRVPLRWSDGSVRAIKPSDLRKDFFRPGHGTPPKKEELKKVSWRNFSPVTENPDGIDFPSYPKPIDSEAQLGLRPRIYRLAWRDAAVQSSALWYFKKQMQLQTLWNPYHDLLLASLKTFNPKDMEVMMAVVESRLNLNHREMIIERRPLAPDLHRYPLVPIMARLGVQKYDHTSFDDHLTWLTQDQLKAVLAVIVLYYQFEEFDLYQNATTLIERCRNFLSKQDRNHLSELMTLKDIKKA